jgi:hypothetical protein
MVGRFAGRARTGHAAHPSVADRKSFVRDFQSSPLTVPDDRQLATDCAL